MTTTEECGCTTTRDAAGTVYFLSSCRGCANRAWADRKVVPARFLLAHPDDLSPQLAELGDGEGAYITGTVGTGKTFQAAALLRARYARSESLPFDAHRVRAVWRNVPSLLEEIRRSFGDESRAPVALDRCLQLVLDDLGAEKPTEWVEERLYKIVNDRYERGLPVIVTSNLTLNQLADKIGVRISSRLRGMCKTVGLRGDDRRRREPGAAA